MTTTTDWDVQDADTGSHAIVTDVTSAATDNAPVYTGEETVAVRKLNAQLTDQMRRLDAENVRLSAAYEQARADLEALRAELHPLDARRTGWTPGPRAMPARHWSQVHGVDDLTQPQQRAALVAPTLPELRDGDEYYAGAPLAAELMAGVDHSPGWPTWLGQVHHADAAWADIVARLRAMPDTYAAPPVERTVVEPVEVDTSYRETEAWALADMVLGGRDRETGDVLAGPYSQLAPERLDEQALVPTGAPDEHDPPQRDDEPDDRVQRMAEGRRRRDTLATRSSDDEPTSDVGASQPTSKSEPPRVGGWRVWAASIGLGIVGLAATIGALAVLA